MNKPHLHECKDCYFKFAESVLDDYEKRGRNLVLDTIRTKLESMKRTESRKTIRYSDNSIGNISADTYYNTALTDTINYLETLK